MGTEYKEAWYTKHPRLLSGNIGSAFIATATGVSISAVVTSSAETLSEKFVASVTGIQDVVHVLDKYVYVANHWEEISNALEYVATHELSIPEMEASVLHAQEMLAAHKKGVEFMYEASQYATTWRHDGGIEELVRDDTQPGAVESLAPDANMLQEDIAKAKDLVSGIKDFFVDRQIDLENTVRQGQYQAGQVVENLGYARETLPSEEEFHAATGAIMQTTEYLSRIVYGELLPLAHAFNNIFDNFRLDERLDTMIVVGAVLAVGFVANKLSSNFLTYRGQRKLLDQLVYKASGHVFQGHWIRNPEDMLPKMQRMIYDRHVLYTEGNTAQEAQLSVEKKYPELFKGKKGEKRREKWYAQVKMWEARNESLPDNTQYMK